MNTKTRILIAAYGFLLTTQFASATQDGLPPSDIGYTVDIPAKSAFYSLANSDPHIRNGMRFWIIHKNQLVDKYFSEFIY